MMRLLRVAMFVLPLLLSACVPAKFTGFRPTGDGRLERGPCVAGLRDRLRLRAPAGVEVRVYTLTHGYRAAVLLNVDLDVPAGAVARWESPRLVLRSAEWSRPRTWMIDRIVAGARTFDATAPLSGGPGRRAARYRLTFYSTEMGTIAEPAIPLAREFTLELPALIVNEERSEPGPVRFTAFHEWGVYTCLQ